MARTLQSPHRAPRPVLAATAGLALVSVAATAAGQSYFYSGSITRAVNSVVTFSEPYQSSLPGQAGVFQSLFPPESIATTTMRAQSGAGPGYITASTYSQIIKNTINDGAFTVQFGGSGFARSIWTDIEVSGNPGMVPSRIRVHLTGSMSAGTSLRPRAISTVQIFFRINGQSAGGGSIVIDVNGGNKTVTESGLLTGFSGNAVIESNQVMVPANTPFPLELQLTASASTSLFWGFSGDASALCDFSHTLTLATDRPVFNLPPGYTANSTQARIVNNTFTIPCPADLFHDTQVDDADFSIFVVAYNLLDCADPAMFPGCPADFNNDGFVDDADFLVFLTGYNELLCP